jgi:hypothetical protein
MYPARGAITLILQLWDALQHEAKEQSALEEALWDALRDEAGEDLSKGALRTAREI